MERELLLLGLLRNQEMHGYQIAEFLDGHYGMFFELKKATAYHLLGKMKEKGLVSAREEQEGNRPPRRVYAITDKGETVFQEILRESLAQFRPAAFPDNVAMLFLGALPSAEANELLEMRQRRITELLEHVQAHMRAHESEELDPPPLLIHRQKYLATELEWLGEVIDRLESNGAQR